MDASVFQRAGAAGQIGCSPRGCNLRMPIHGLFSQIESAEQPLAAICAFKGQNGFRAFKKPDGSMDQSRMVFAGAQKSLHLGKGGVGVVILRICGQLCVPGVYGKPWPGGGKTALGGRGIPRHGGAGPVASQSIGPIGNGFGIAQIFKWNMRLRQAQFLTLVNKGRAAQAA